MAAPNKATPTSHPQKDGLEAVVRDGVQTELDRRGVGGGGGDDRLAQLEKDVAVIQATMVTKESLESELGKLRLAIERVPLVLMKWLGGIIGVIAAVAAIVVAIMKMTGTQT